MFGVEYFQCTLTRLGFAEPCLRSGVNPSCRPVAIGFGFCYTEHGNLHPVFAFARFNAGDGLMKNGPRHVFSGKPVEQTPPIAVETNF